MKKIILPIIIALVPCLVKAQEAMSFVTVPHETAALSLGQTISSPASLTDYAGISGAVGYMQWAPDAVASNDISARTSWSNGAFGFGFEYIGGFGSEFPVYGEDGFQTGTYKSSTIQLGLGAAYKIAGKYSVGADFHYASEALDVQSSYSAFFANVAASAQFDALTVGGGIARLGSAVVSESGDSYSLPASAFVNGSYNLSLGDALAVKAMAEAQLFFTGGLGIGAGAQLSIVDILHIRAGYHVGTADAPVPSFLSLGAGVEFAGVSIETCFLTASPTIGNTVGLALGFKF